ncbi:DUF3566 domain-containing protein [Promicromonospora sp. NFX87]|uniref:DUF3566 domain-containing protein n=1 Tax=Promicromonospora sp. NFX87 TaxID=3402691 RepID=UPI003AFB27FE
MTSDKSGPVRTASPELDEDLEITRDRKEVNGEQAPAETPDPKQAEETSSKSSASTKADAAESGAATSGSGAAGENADLPVPAPSTKRPGSGAATPAPSAPEESSIPTTGGVWRSAYEAGRTGKDSKPATPAAPAVPAAPAAPATPASSSSATPPKQATPPAPPAPATPTSSEPVAGPGPVSPKSDTPAPASDATAKSWNRVPAPTAPPAPPTAAPEGTDGVRAGAMKAAQAALDAARSAAKKVTSIMPDDDARSATPANETTARPEMHYTAAGVRGTAAPAPAQAAGTAPQPSSEPTPEAPRSAPAGPRRVRLAISRVDPWSVMKLAFLLAVAIAIMTVVATAVFWSVLNSLGVFTTIQDFVKDAVGPQSDVNLTQFVEFPRVISLATLISICNIVLLTAIATIMAFLYNITAALVGGVHMTLTDD